MSVDLKYSYNV